MYLGPCQTFITERFVKTVDDKKHFIIKKASS